MRAAIVIAALSGLAAGTASADVFTWNWTAGDGGAQISDAGGEFQSIFAKYNTNTQALTFSVTFADTITEGYTLALSTGSDPQGVAGEFALLYYDATDGADPKVSVYGYNGQNGHTSYRDGTGDPGTQTPDRIVTSVAPTANLPSIFTNMDDGGSRTLGFRIDTSTINAHSPLYDDAGGWEGIQFAEELGIWLHPYADLSTGYNDMGYLEDWSGVKGWFDGGGFLTDVPAPGSLALLGLGGLAMARRHR